ncbi:sensor histidine kinase [Bacillus sp. FJAT-26390]|uniref:sensor histidine kinase n=1 Tax=Bacillus sp. FJAT-26390 TaxID=1743142 RepID=UPI000807B7F7|nr:sensor histidine kinase [Bacillus sp. FJAT-26390]OBZ13681.1 peptidase C56 [Bacillus sp. FJAT-26390]
MRGRPFFQFKSIHTSIALAFSCLIICTTVILSVNTYLISSDAVKDNSYDYTAQLIEQVNTNIQTYIGNMESIADLALRDEELQRLMRLSDPQDPEGLALARQTSTFFRSIAKSRNDIASIVFIGTNGALVSDRDDAQLKDYHELLKQDWYKTAKAAGGKSVISSSRVQHVYKNEYNWVVSISRQAEGAADGNSGVLLVDLNYNVINDLCKQIHMGNRGYVFLLDPTGDLIYHPQQQLVYSGLKSEAIEQILQLPDTRFLKAKNDGMTKLYTIRSSRYGWKVIGVNYPEDLVGDKGQIQFSAMLWGSLCLIIALIISILLSLTLTRPIKKLEGHMKKVEKGDFNTRFEIEGINEIGKLARTFNLMTGKIKELMSQVVQEQEDKRISELKALQAQIHPHFLYNTLDSIIWMAEMGKMNDVINMTSALSKLLRSTISKGEELIPIRAELAHIEHYLTIQNIRYRNKFAYSIEVDPAIMDKKILKIVLQPIVENAIYHGIKNKADAGHILIKGYRTNEGITLQIIDDGVGMDATKLQTLAAKGRPQPHAVHAIPSPSAASASATSGLGLQNVNHRIQLNFGERFGLSFDSELDEGTTVTLRLPELMEDKGD